MTLFYIDERGSIMEKRWISFSVAVLVAVILAAGPAAAEWVALESTMPNPGADTNRAVYLDGKIYVVGGIDTVSFTWNNAVRILDVATDTWTNGAAAPIKPARAVPVTDGVYIYYISFIDEGSANTAVKIYDPATDSWSDGAAFAATEGQTATYDPESGLIYVTGRNVPTAVYDPETDAFDTDLAALPSSNVMICADVIDGSLVVAGGAPDFFLSPAATTPEALDLTAETLVDPEPGDERGPLRPRLRLLRRQDHGHRRPVRRLE